MTARRISGLYAITPDSADLDRLLAGVESSLAGGARVIQYRNKSADAPHLAMASALAELCRRYGVPLIVNDDVMDHPFHLHVNPFQVISRAGRPESQRRWKDTVLVLPGETVRVQVTFSRYPGLYLYHCHILEHEDMGMMRNFRIVPF